MNVPPRLGLQTRVDEVTHPSECTGNPYSQDMRQMVMFIVDHVLGGDQQDYHGVRNMVDILRGNHIYPSSRTCRRWAKLQDDHGHLRPCRRSGNSFAERMSGPDLIYLAIFRAFYPKATIAETNAFLYRANLGNPFWNFYSQSQIHRGECLIGLSRKRSSTTAYQALYPVNLQKRWDYWNLPYPLGIADIRRSQIIDLDECGMYMETTANRKYGKAVVGLRVNETGPYSKSEKWNLLLAVSGEDPNDGQAARRWAQVWVEGGTTVTRFLDFMQELLDSIGYATDDNFYVFTMDNLNAHKNVAVIALIQHYGHGVVFRAPYWPVDGPIEFVFNTIQTLVRAKLYEIRTGEDLVGAIYEAVASIDSFANYFINCGFILN